eukprot:TRINITY_DN2799_c0_g1_i1.p1 TRINITY_DN2799_c0_g1~~TRINITY_DN2799_c0_g1_i1.p1  ORF type:complete len:637 (+),score=145.86 TRINITY_DN2799_c0_g1_i1:3219-5129(+)
MKKKSDSIPNSIRNKSINQRNNNFEAEQRRLKGGSKKVVSLKNNLKKSSSGKTQKRKLTNSNSSKVHREHKETFVRKIESFRLEHEDDIPKHNVDINSNIIVALRKRPIFQFELDDNMFDCVTVKQNLVYMHRCQLDTAWQPTIVNTTYQLDYAFDEAASNDNIYTELFRPQIPHVFNGGLSLIVYGQTGSGKTFTVDGIIERVCADLLGLIDSTDVMQLSIIESFGNEISDLITGNDVEIFDDSTSNNLFYKNLHAIEISSVDMFLDVIDESMSQRRSSSTNRNDRSSRSHAIIRISMLRNEIEIGNLTLVDLAGSERSADSLYHDKEASKETALINSSLMNLKECIRSRGSTSQSVRVPYRTSKLTMLLKHCFTNPNHKTIFMGMISPIAADDRHSMGTLQFLDRLKISETKARDTSLIVNWSKNQVQEFVKNFLTEQRHSLNIQETSQYFQMNGRSLINLTVSEAISKLGNELNLAEKFVERVTVLKKIKSSANLKSKNCDFQYDIMLNELKNDLFNLQFIEKPFDARLSPNEFMNSGKNLVIQKLKNSKWKKKFEIDDPDLKIFLHGIFSGFHILAFTGDKLDLVRQVWTTKPYLSKEFVLFTTLPVKNETIYSGCKGNLLKNGIFLMIQTF